MKGTQLKLTGNPESPPHLPLCEYTSCFETGLFFLYSVVLPWSTVYGLMRDGDGLPFKLKEDHPATVSGEQQALRKHRN